METTKTITFAEIEEEICTSRPHSGCMGVILEGETPVRATLTINGAAADFLHFQHTYPAATLTLWERVEGDTWRQIPEESIRGIADPETVERLERHYANLERIAVATAAAA